jgi:hypothetical protein
MLSVFIFRYGKTLHDGFFLPRHMGASGPKRTGKSVFAYHIVAERGERVETYFDNIFP